MAKPKAVDFQKAKEEQTILSGIVKIAERGIDREDGQHLIIECGGRKVIIEKEEIEPLPFNQSFTKYVGTEMKFIVTDYAKEVDLIFGSNKKAIAVMKQPILDKLNNGEVMKGIITHVVKHGAYVSIGLVSGLLKNTNFSDDGTTVADVYREGEEINVKYLRTSERGNILFVPEEQIKGESHISFKDFERGQVVVGRAVKVCTNEVYVNIAPRLDALCAYPDTIADLKEGDFVRIRIIKVFQEKKRVRGTIVNLLNF